MRPSPFICRTCLERFHKFRPATFTLRKTARHGYSTTATTTRPFRCAIIGSGPAGFYAAARLLQKLPSARIDMYEALPTPFGLVRFGVAPDHPEVKNCIDKFNEVASHPSFTFVGNVSIGDAKEQLPLKSLRPHYDAMLFAYGASRDRKLGIPGEGLKGVYSARDFVGWYNGLPEHANLLPDLDNSEEALVIGQGNVALDVARTLLSPIDRLRGTDMTEQALEVLSKSRVRRVRIVGRRGPLQAPYTIKEVRELMQLPDVAFRPVDRSILPADLKKLPRQLSRIAQVIAKGSPTEASQARKAWELVYMRSPAMFNEDDSRTGKLGSVTFDHMQFTQDPSAIPPDDLNGLKNLRVQRAEPNAQERLDAGIAFRSVGYQSEPLQGFDDLGIPFDRSMGIIPNDVWGRVMAPDRGPGELTAGHVPGMYCAGWVKRGPTGVIASTMDDAFTTADIIARDWTDDVKFDGSAGADDVHGDMKAGWDAVKQEIVSRGIRSVSWEDWQFIDAEERERGKKRGKEREKCTSVAEMLKILDA